MRQKRVLISANAILLAALGAHVCAVANLAFKLSFGEFCLCDGGNTQHVSLGFCASTGALNRIHMVQRDGHIQILVQDIIGYRCTERFAGPWTCCQVNEERKSSMHDDKCMIKLLSECHECAQQVEHEKSKERA